MDFEKFRNILVKILLATVVAASAVAVGVILIGSVNDIMGRVIGTFIAAIFYVIVLLGVLSAIPRLGEGGHSRSDLFVVNSVLALVCASYLTSMLSIWSVISGDMPGRMHLAYFVLLIGVLYAKPLMNLEENYARLRNYIYANYIFIAVVCVMMVVAICAPDEWQLWEGLFGRIIAAAIVICVTLSMVITVLYHLYAQQDPEMRAKRLAAQESKQAESTHRLSGVQVAFWLIIAIFIGLPLLGILLSFISRLLLGSYF